LIETISNIRYRIEYQWREEYLPAETPKIESALHLVESLKVFLNPYHDSDKELVVQGKLMSPLDKFINCSQIISHQLWHNTIPEHERSLKFYHHDLVVYLGVSYYAIQTLKLCSPQMGGERLPSLQSFWPQVTPEQIQMLKPLVQPLPGWMNEIGVEQLLIPYCEMLNRLSERVHHPAMKHPMLPTLILFLNVCRRYPPKTFEAEKKRIEVFGNFIDCLDQVHQKECSRQSERQIIKLLLQSGVEEEEFQHVAVANYVISLYDSPVPGQLHQEENYWRQQMKLGLKEYRLCFLLLKHHLKERKNDTGSSHEEGMHFVDKIQWKGGGEEFVKVFLGLIRKGLIIYKGNSDLAPIVQQLFKFIAVEKSRGMGYLTESSCLSYFKKQSAEVY
jgi:hypothetical protein